MKEQRISVTEAKQQLGEIIKRVAYGGERFVIEVHGRPQALVSPYRERPRMTIEEHRARIEEATRFRKQIEARTGIQPDSAEIIRQMREERDEQLFGRD
jgi:prevent-host-death family protein